MATKAIGASEMGVLAYTDFTHTIATVTAAGTADEVGSATSGIYEARFTRDYSPAKTQSFQSCMLFDLAAVPKNARIISGSIAITTDGTAVTSGTPSSLYFRIVGPGDANDPIEVDDLRPIDDAPAALTTDVLYNDATPDVALTATGVTHVQTWLDSDSKVKFTMQSVAALNGDDPYNDNFEIECLRWEDATLTLTYEEPAAGLLGCNF